MTHKPLHIAVNARFLLAGKLEGLGRFSDQVLREMTARHPDVQFTLLFDRPYDPQFVYGPNVRPVVLFPQARHPALYIWWFDFSVARYLNRHRPDVFFSPDGYLSLRTQVPQVPVIHDLAFRHFPQFVGPAHRWHFNRYFPRYARRAAHVLTVSDFSRHDIHREYGIPLECITPVYNGAGPQFRPADAETQQGVRQHYTDGQPYFVYAGAIQPRKNLSRLLEAFDRFKTHTGLPHRLLLTGRKAWNFDKIIESYQQMRHRGDVAFTGYVPDDELSVIYAASVALCYVSVFEGFGLPILEAMQAETAIIASNTSSMPEVTGAAGLLVDPYNVDDIAAALQQLATQPELRQRLIEAGREQHKKFTWAQTAEACFTVLAAVAKRA